MTTSQTRTGLSPHLSPKSASPRLVGDPREETFADFWITYQLCADQDGVLGWEQIYYAKSKAEALAVLKPVVHGLGFKMTDGESQVTLHRQGQALFQILRQLLNYGWYDGTPPEELSRRIPPLA